MLGSGFGGLDVRIVQGGWREFHSPEEHGLVDVRRLGYLVTHTIQIDIVSQWRLMREKINK